MTSYGTSASLHRNRGRLSNKNYIAGSYQDIYADTRWYSAFQSIVNSKGIGVLRLSTNAGAWGRIMSGTEKVVYLGTSTLPVNLTIPENTVCSRDVVIFVSGNLSMSRNFTNANNSSACLFVISKDLTLVARSGGGGADSYNAGFFVDGTFRSTQNNIIDGATTAPNTRPANIYGFVITKDSQFSRHFKSSNTASEEFSYDPRYLVLFAEVLGSRSKKVFECGVVDVPECDLVNRL